MASASSHPAPIRPTPPPLKSVLEPSVLDEVEQIGAYLNTIHSHFDQASELAELGAFSSMFAHEVNNLMAQVGGRAQLALMHMDQPEMIMRALQIACHASTQIAQLSEIFIATTAHDPSRTPNTRIGQIHHQALDFVDDLDIQAYGMTIVGDTELRVAIVPVLLKQVLLNLYLNAIRAIEHGAPLDSRIRAEGEITTTIELIEPRASSSDQCSPWNIARVRLSVVDTGVGMEPEELAGLFKKKSSDESPKAKSKHPHPHPHAHAHANANANANARDRGLGHGLGLAICQKMIVEAGGTIGAESTPGVGTKMIITLPLAEREPPTA